MYIQTRTSYGHEKIDTRTMSEDYVMMWISRMIRQGATSFWRSN